MTANDRGFRAAFEEATRAIAACATKKNKHLNLQGRNLRRIPDSIGSLVHLERLDCFGGGITSLPDTMQGLTHLRSLQINLGKSFKIPSWISMLPSLEILNLMGGKIIEGFDVIPKIASLETLGLQNLGLRTVPEWAVRCTGVKQLWLCGNQLQELPAAFTSLIHLCDLNLQSNEFNEIPAILHELPRLKELYLEENKGLPIPNEILARGSAHEILTYARKLTDRGGRRPLNEAKMILVGRGAVGKTTLVHQLVHRQFVEKHKTKGIKVSDWKVPGKAGEVSMHVWDFGGQEIMHGTHQFFLTERSLYLLVLAGREDKEDEDAEYWLKMIRAFGGDSPVIVVLNKIKEHRFDLNEEALREKYPNIRAFIETDCKSNTGIRTLRARVLAEIEKMESIRASFPAAWFEIKQRLTDMPENFMGFDQFRAICAEHGEKSAKEQDELAKFLHILGIALNYRDDPRLCETSVLNPHWVTTGIYRLLNDDAIRKRRGLLKPSDLDRVLPEKDYPKDMHVFLLRLTKKFELCFPLDEEGRDYLIPELLGKKQPKLNDEFGVDNCLCFEYHYGSLLPEGLLPRFIVRAYTRIVDDLRWRTGVVLEWKGARALVKADEEDRQVLIRVRGTGDHSVWDIHKHLTKSDNVRREFMALIRDHFDHIHRNFKMLEPVEKVRVPDYPELLVDYSKVELYGSVSAGKMEEYWKGRIFSIDARQIIHFVELPRAPRGARNRGAALAGGEMQGEFRLIEGKNR